MNDFIDALKQQFPDGTVEITGEGGKFLATVVSEQFAGLSKIARHKLVYKALNPYIASGEIHALTIVANTASES